MQERTLVTCSICNYAQVGHKHELTCHRYAPQTQANSSMAFWPVVKGADWCGDGEGGGTQRKERDE